MENSIVIRNLPKDIYVPELCEHFKCFGNILSASIQYNVVEQSTSEAGIEFDDQYSAVKAVKSMNNFKMKNRTLHISLSVENNHFRQIFVKNIPSSWDECDLMNTFKNIGAIETVKISEDSSGKSNGFGFILFTNHITAKKAVQCMNGKTICGQNMIVERFKCKSERDSLMQNSLEQVEKRLHQSVQLNNLYIKNLPTDMSEDQFRKLFEKFGVITSVKIAVDENGVSKHFGFISFEKKEDAEKALKRMNGHTVKSKMLQIYFKEDGQLRKQYNILKNKEKDVKIKQYKQQAKSVPKFMPHGLNFYRE